MESSDMTTTTTTTTEGFSVCDRLQWVRHHSSLWWPAIQYESYGELLGQLDENVPFRVKNSIALAVVRTKNQGRVSRLIGVEPMTVIPTNSTRDFYQHLGQFVEQASTTTYGRHYQEFQRAMDLTMEYMTNEVPDGNESPMIYDHDRLLTQPLVPETPTSVDSRPPQIHGTPIHKRDSWDDAWDKMRHSGWTWRIQPNSSDEFYYIKPGASIKNGEEGVDYFASLEQVQEYARLCYNWKGEVSSDNSQEMEEESLGSRDSSEDKQEEFVVDNNSSQDEQEEASLASNIKSSTSTRKRSNSTKKSRKRTADKGRVWGRERKRKHSQVQDCNSVKRARVETSDSDDEHYFYVWNNLFQYLKKNGWKAVKARNPLHDWYYVRPGKSVTDGTLGEDYFMCTNDVIDYAKRINLHLQASPSSSQEESSTASSQYSVTPDRRPVPQDPGIPLLSPSEDESSDDDERYEWVVLWPRLKQSGWTAVKARGLHDWYYVRPGRSVKGGTVGVDYFVSTQDVIEHERMADERDDGGDRDHSPLGLELEQEADANSSDSTSLTQRRHIQYPNSPVISPKQQWWKHEPVPHFTKQVWPVLKDKLDFRYSHGQYVLPGVSLKNKATEGHFVSEREMRIYMCRSGIPNFDSNELTKEERKTLRRWVTFSNLPVTDQNSISRLESVPLLSSKDAWVILSTQLGYKKANEKYIPPFAELLPGNPVLGKHYFETLDQLRCFIRASLTLDGSDEIECRSRKRKSGQVISEEQALSLRLWAATSPAPLRAHSFDKQDDQEDESGSTCAKEDQLQTQDMEESASVSGSIALSDSTSSRKEKHVDRSRRVTMDPFEFDGSDSMDEDTKMPSGTSDVPEIPGIHMTIDGMTFGPQ